VRGNLQHMVLRGGPSKPAGCSAGQPVFTNFEQKATVQKQEPLGSVKVLPRFLTRTVGHQATRDYS